ncbi:1,4-Dihydroxy-2-naphthoyl-CoA synthase [bacterium BMS3Abin05]|nr:1,4-Dihydroxy-2-naphthoyl-CoA synthase [bacterium BMS3Abin05]GBE27622.1 1,4-Dihydroxy-2-naphthoyl-CoA synthase [bacterium BMS3Bbin03]
MKSTLIEQNGPIATITMNRPEKHNAFGLETMSDLVDMFHGVEKDSSVRLVVLTGAGAKSFCTGADLVDLLRFDTAEKARRFALKVDEMMDTVMSCPKPTIAAINGFALGGGFGLAAACDLRVMSRQAKIGFPAVRIGAVLPVGCSFRVMALMGLPKSKELMLTARMVGAEEALQLGLVNAVASPEKLMEKVRVYTEEILQGGDQALTMTKLILNQKLRSEIQQYAALSPDSFAYLSTTGDWKQRIEAFVNRKK